MPGAVDHLHQGLGGTRSIQLSLKFPNFFGHECGGKVGVTGRFNDSVNPAILKIEQIPKRPAMKRVNKKSGCRQLSVNRKQKSRHLWLGKVLNHPPKWRRSRPEDDRTFRVIVPI